MSRTVETGTWAGHPIRRARKQHRCDWDCKGTIAVGDLYVEGDCDPYEAGGFGHDRICLACAEIEVEPAQ